jgi:hypothetical protein
MEPDVVNRQVRELEALRKQKRFWQYGSVALVVLIAVVCLLRLRGAVRDLVNEGPAQKIFVEDMGKSMQTHVIPAVEEYGQQAIKEIDLGGEVRKLNTRTPELAQASLKELNHLRDELPKRGEKIWKSSFEASMKTREKKIRAMYPELKDDQVNGVMASLMEQAQIQVVGIDDALFSKHQQALKDIETSIDHIRDTEPKTNVEPATWEMALMIFDIAREDLRTLETKPDSSKTGKAGGASKSGGKGDSK